MTTSPTWRRPTLVTIRATFTLLAWILVAPVDARAGCSHLVSSRTDWAQLPSFLQDESADREGTVVGLLHASSTPDPPRQCRGASGTENQPASTAPEGGANPSAKSWALSPALGDHAAATPVRLDPGGDPLHSIHAAFPVFHPPR